MYKKQAEYCAVVLSKFMIFMIITQNSSGKVNTKTKDKTTHMFSHEKIKALGRRVATAMLLL